MNLSKAAILEISELSNRAEHLARGSASERSQATVLLSRIASIRQVGISSDEMRAQYAAALGESVTPGAKEHPEYRAKFDRYISGRIDDVELRDFLAGTQSIFYTQGAPGGYTVPLAYDDTLREANAQTDPVLDEAVTDFTSTAGPFLQPSRISGYDLSTITANLVGEAQQQTQQVIPTVAGGPLRSDIIYKISLAASMEAEQDIPDFAAKIVRASAVALARRIGKAVLTGGGGADIKGVTTILNTPSIQIGTGNEPVGGQTAGNVTAQDLNSVYFSVNRWYRAQKKCGWLMNDAAYKSIRNAVDNVGHPLLSVERDSETLYGKPVYVSPSLYLGQSIGIGVILFGDLSAIVVRASRPTLQRVVEQSIADITRGESLYIARARCDATLFDPSAGSAPPIVMASIQL